VVTEEVAVIRAEDDQRLAGQSLAVKALEQPPEVIVELRDQALIDLSYVGFFKESAGCSVMDLIVGKKRNENGLCVLTAVGERPIKIAVGGYRLEREVLTNQSPEHYSRTN
jgi:hypothetical protein